MTCEHNHPEAALTTSDDGTSYCRWCEDIATGEEEREAAIQEAARLYIIVRECRDALRESMEAYNRVLDGHITTLENTVKDQSQMLDALAKLADYANWEYCHNVWCWMGEDSPTDIAQAGIGPKT